MTAEEVQNIAVELRDIQYQMQRLEQAHWWQRIFSLPRVRKRLHQLQEGFDRGLRQFLENENPEFASLAKENMSLLENDRFIYKTKTAQYNPIGTYTAFFRGQIHPDGYAHLQLARTNVGVYPLSKYDYVSKYLGKVDYLGHIELKAVKIASSMVFTMPRTYRGYVNDKGVMVLEVVKRDAEMASGHRVISGLIGLHFDDEKKASLFWTNRRRMLEILEQEKQKFLKQIKP